MLWLLGRLGPEKLWKTLPKCFKPLWSHYLSENQEGAGRRWKDGELDLLAPEGRGGQRWRSTQLALASGRTCNSLPREGEGLYPWGTPYCSSTLTAGGMGCRWGRAHQSHRCQRARMEEVKALCWHHHHQYWQQNSNWASSSACLVYLHQWSWWHESGDEEGVQRELQNKQTNQVCGRTKLEDLPPSGIQLRSGRARSWPWVLSDHTALHIELSVAPVMLVFWEAKWEMWFLKLGEMPLPRNPHYSKYLSISGWSVWKHTSSLRISELLKFKCPWER